MEGEPHNELASSVKIVREAGEEYGWIFKTKDLDSPEAIREYQTAIQRIFKEAGVPIRPPEGLGWEAGKSGSRQWEILPGTEINRQQVEELLHKVEADVGK